MSPGLAQLVVQRCGSGVGQGQGADSVLVGAQDGVQTIGLQDRDRGLQPDVDRRLREQLGDDFFSDVVSVTLPYHSRADIDTSALLAFRGLRSLDLSGTHIGDADLQKIIGMNHLEELRLADTDVTDDGIRWIAQLPSLKTLSLRGTVLSDRGLLAMAQMNTLQELDITDTNVTQQGLLQLQTALVNCRVNIGMTATRKPLKW
jgi:hypothetical protein